MRDILFVFLLFQAPLTNGQPCHDYTSLTHDKDGERMYAFNKHIDIEGENGQRLFSIYGFVWNSTPVLVVEVVNEFRCFGLDSKAILEFSDGSRAEGQNTLSNCERQLVLQLNEGQPALEFLKTKYLVLLQVVTKSGVRAVTQIEHHQAEQVRLSVACLSSFQQRNETPDSVVYEKSLSPRQPPSDSTVVYTVVEHQPEFFGGYAALIDFVQENLKVRRKHRIAGTVWISFIVEKDGTIKQAEVLKGLSPEIDAEALRVVSLMPLWKPGLQNGKPVSVRFVLPIKF